MGIPLIQELWDGIRWSIDFFMDKIPRPLKIAFFLIFLLLFGVFIPFMLHTFGVHCNSNSQVVKTSSLDILTNLKIAFIDPDEQTNISSFQPDIIGFDTIGNLGGVPCSYDICYYPNDDAYYWESNSICENRTILKPFLTKHFDFESCVTCDGDINYSIILEAFGFRTADYFCYGDAYPIPYENRSWTQKILCNPSRRCMPPPHYYYDYDTGLFTCYDIDVCGIFTNITTVYKIDDYLHDAGGELMYDNQNKNDYKKMMLFKCQNDGQPILTLYGIPLFDYKIWLMIIVIAVLIMFLSMIKN